MCSTVQDPLVALADTDDSYHQLSSFCDQKYQLMWYYMHAAPRPCFTRKLLIKLWRFRGASIERLRRRSTRLRHSLSGAGFRGTRHVQTGR